MIFSLFVTIGFALTFPEAFELAQKNAFESISEKLDLKKAQLQKKELRAEFLPSLEARSTTTWQDQDENASAFSSLQNDRQHTASLTLNQPLFAGGAIFYGLEFAGNLPKLQKLRLDLYYLSLQENLAKLFNEILENQELMKVKEEQIDLLKERIGFLKKRANIGQSQKTEVIQAESQLARAQAELASLESTFLEKKEKFQNYTGLSEVPKLKEDHDLKQFSLPREWKEALKKHALVRFNELATEQSDIEVKEARGSFLPNVDLSGDYFLDRPDYLGDGAWEVSVSATWEIWNSGKDLSRLKQKDLEKRRNQELKYYNKTRLNRQYQSISQRFQAKKNEQEKLDKAQSLARASYLVFVKDYKKGLVSNLDVLQSLNDYLQIKTQHIQSIYEVKNLYYKAKTTAGIYE